MSGAAPHDGPSTHAAPVAIVAGHGDVAAGLVSAVAAITGRAELLLAVTNRDRGPAEIEAALREAIAAGTVRVLFTDLPAGSCTIAARRVLRDHPALALVTGVNLPALVDFVLRADAECAQVAPEEAGAALAAHAVEKGRASLVAVAPPSAPTAPAPPSGALAGAPAATPAPSHAR